MTVVIGQGSHMLSFVHPVAGELQIFTGMDKISWGYTLNTANFPTYGGEVIQILSCFVEDLEISGTLRSYQEMQALHDYFYKYIKDAAGVDNNTGHDRDETPIVMSYPHRNWLFNIIVTDVPGYRRATELVAPEWQIKAFVVDRGLDVANLEETLIEEASIKLSLNSSDPNFTANFGLEGKIRFTDSLFSDPKGKSPGEIAGLDESKFDPDTNLKQLGDYFHNLLPSYLQGDFDTVIQGIGSKPTFNIGPKSTSPDSKALNLPVKKKN